MSAAGKVALGALVLGFAALAFLAARALASGVGSAVGGAIVGGAAGATNGPAPSRRVVVGTREDGTLVYGDPNSKAGRS